ncbi:MAG: hypothetical protein GWO20_04125, partial [Candidatus Korarchaeota archaeon]|nr:hypothetical protein [Candidatus Korarchaeota archaeon]
QLQGEEEAIENILTSDGNSSEVYDNFAKVLTLLQRFSSKDCMSHWGTSDYMLPPEELEAFKDDTSIRLVREGKKGRMKREGSYSRV